MTLIKTKSDGLSLILLICVLTAILLTFRDYGITHDEPLQQNYGNTIRDYYNSGREDKAALSYHNCYLYGGAFDYTAAALTHHSPLGIYETRHLYNALIGLLGIIAVWKTARLLGGPKAALLAGLILTLTPSWWGHMFNNPKDIPFAVGYAWTLYYLLLSLEKFPRLSPTLILRFGIALGLTLGVRIGGGLLVLYMMAAASLYWILPRWFSNGETTLKPLWQRIVFLAMSGMAVVLIAYGVMLLAWPFAQQHPIANPGIALDRMSKFTDWPGTNLIAGKYVDVMNMPKTYLFQYFAVKLPPLIWIGLLATLLSAGLHFFNKQKPARLNITRWLFLLLAVIFPVVYAIAKQSILYDGIRHFIFEMPLLAIIAGCGLASLWNLLMNKWTRLTLSAVVILLALSQIVTMAALHPYQYVYYNIFAGGLPGANNRYETDYWGHTYKEAVDFVEQYARQRDGNAFEHNQYTLFVDGPYLSATYYFPTNFTRTDNRETADFQMTHTRWELQTNLTGRLIGTVHREGVDLNLITARK